MPRLANALLSPTFRMSIYMHNFSYFDDLEEVRHLSSDGTSFLHLAEVLIARQTSRSIPMLVHPVRRFR